MDFFIEFILEMIFEGSAAALKSKAAAKSLRALVIIFTVSMMVLFFALAYLRRDHTTQMYAFLGIGIVITYYLSGFLKESIRKMDRL